MEPRIPSSLPGPQLNLHLILVTLFLKRLAVELSWCKVQFDTFFPPQWLQIVSQQSQILNTF